jgi:hypothetical protein
VNEKNEPLACGDEAKILLSRFVDGELPPEDRQKVEEHVLGCVPCRELLALFQKNENLVASALSTDAFGEAVVASVVRRLDRAELPEAKPVEEGVLDWVRSRPWISSAAAALLVASLVLVLNASHSSELAQLKGSLKSTGEELGALKEKNRKTELDLQQQLRSAVDVQKELARMERERVIKDAIAHSPDTSGLLYVEPEHYLVARTVFTGKAYTGFNVYRRVEAETGDAAWKRMNADVLQTPEFVDRTVKAGVSYIYKFEALRKTGDPVPSVPMVMRVPMTSDLTAESSVWINCMELAAPKDLAVFVLERTIGGKTYVAKFYTELGKPVGGKVKVDDVEVDFSTDLVLSRIDTGTQAAMVIFTEPALDQNGNPIMEELAAGAFRPATLRHEVSVGQRESKFAALRLAGTEGSKAEQKLWKGERMQVRASASR